MMFFWTNRSQASFLLKNFAKPLSCLSNTVHNSLSAAKEFSPSIMTWCSMWSKSPNGRQFGKNLPSPSKDGKVQRDDSTPMSVKRDLTASLAISTEEVSRASIRRVAFALKGTDVALLPRTWKGQRRHLMSNEDEANLKRNVTATGRDGIRFGR